MESEANQSAQQQLQLRAEQIKGIFEQAPMTSLNSWVTGLIVVFIPNPAASTLSLFGWFTALTLSCGARLLVAWQFKKRAIPLKHHERWGLAYAATISSTALIWASALFVLASPTFPEYEMLFLVILVAMCIGASHASTTYLIAGQAYTLPAMGAVTLFCLYRGTPMFLGLAILAAIYTVMMYVVGRDSNQRFLEIQRLRLELGRQKEEAEYANIAKSKFLAAASHDLRQPLHALTLFTTALKEKITFPDVVTIVENIDKSVLALQGLFNGLLDISKLDAGSITVEKTAFPLENILSPIKNEFTAEAEDKGLHLRFPENNSLLYTDPSLLSRILRNLISNAIRHTDSGNIVISAEKKNALLILSVTDTGRGIPLEKQDDIYREFVQLDNPERDREKGLGLGLAIVHRLVEMLEIQLTLDSAPNRGSCFSLAIPLAEDQTIHVADTNKPQHSTQQQHQSGLNVVIIDDEAAVREGGLTLLDAWGFNVQAFADADTCIDYLEHNGFEPDVILSDYRLQNNLTGAEAIRKINAHLGREVDAAIITGDTAPDRIKEAEASGYLLMHKPFKPMQLRNFLNRVQQRKPEQV